MTTKSVSIVKITRPSAAGILARKRLFRSLDSGQEHPLTWISGPAGSGKTALIASYLDARKLPCLWYQVDEGDADVATFFYYLGMAAKKAAPRKRKPLPLLTPEYFPGVLTFSRRYFENLYSRLIPSTHPDSSAASRRVDARGRFKRKAGKGRFVIVFDNYQEVPEGSPFHEILREGFLQVPEGIHILLISRRDPPDAFVRLRANRLMEIIGWDELKFTLDESKRMLRFLGHKRVPLRVLEQLHGITDGWAGGIVILMEGMKVRSIESVLSEMHVPREIYGYFAREIFEKEESGIRDFLLKTSFFPQMSSRMAEALTANLQAQRLLSDLILRNLFTQRHESEVALYQYHPLFREFLQVLARETFTPKDLFQIEKEAAMILEANGRTEDAMELLIKAEDWPDVVGLILKYAPKLASQGRGQTLEGWIKRLPESIVQEEPWLLYWAGVCRLPFSSSRSHDFFESAFKQFRSRGDTTGIFLSLTGLFDSRAYGFSDFKPLDQTIALFDKVVQEFPSFPSLAIEARLTASMLVAIVLRQPQHPDFEKRVERALSLLQKTSGLNVKMQTLQALIGHELLSGELSKAESKFDLFRGLAQSPRIPPLLLVVLKNLEAFYYWLTAEFEENQKAVTEGLELSSTTGVHLMDIHLLGHGAAGALSSGDMEAADAFIKKMVSYLDQRSLWGKGKFYQLSSWALLIYGDLSKALSHAESGLKFAVEAGNPQTEAFCHIGYALVLHELKREQKALNHLAKSRALARSAKVPIAEFMCSLAEAQFAFDKGNEPNGLTALKKALSLGQEKGYANTYYWRPSVMADLCKKALEAGIEIKYVQNLIRKRNLRPDPPPYECEQWPWARKVYTLGRFELVKDGVPVRFPVKAPGKVLSFLKVLIAFGRNGASQEAVMDALWPESDGDTARTALDTTLHRLRQLLGSEKFIQLREGHLNLNLRDCMVDAHAFEELLERGEANGSIPLIEKGIALYKGPFLGDPAEPWATAYQERLRSKFIRAIEKLGMYFEKHGQKEKAIDYYQKGLEVDNLAEEFYQSLMACYKSEGRRAEALSVYDRCRKALLSVLGAEPSPRTKAIYESLRFSS